MVLSFFGVKEVVELLAKGIETASKFVWRQTTSEGKLVTQGELRAELAAALELRNEFAKCGMFTKVIDDRLQQAAEA